MDSCSRSISSKKKKNSKKKQKLCKQGGIDRLSNLPDFLLHHVLSFIETKDVIRTSVLSTRWRYLYTSLAIISLKYEPKRTKDETQCKKLKNSFLEFVDRLLILHDASVIRKLHFQSSIFQSIQVHKSRLNCWICAVTKHNVQDLDLHLNVKGHFVLPSCLFTCHSLVTLKLFFQCELKTPLTIHLPNLKILHFRGVSFPDNLSVKRLISNCPVLDELSLVHCDWHDDKSVTISLPMLRSLTIRTDCLEEYFCQPHIKIIAANLACLNISYFEVDFELSGLCSLKTASIDLPYNHIDVDFDDDDERLVLRCLRLFSAIYNVQSLTLQTITVESLMNWEASLDSIPTFYNLTSLTVDPEFTARCFVFLLTFLDKMPKLEYLVLSNACYGRQYEDDSTHLRDEVMQQRVPTCFHSNLKTFATKEFEGDLLEMLAIEYVLRNATGLESLFIYCSKSLEEERLSKAKDHLLNIRCSSASCNVEFCFA